MASLFPALPIQRLPDRDVTANVLARIRIVKVECALTDVAALRDLLLTSRGEELAARAEKALFQLYAYLKERDRAEGR